MIDNDPTHTRETDRATEEIAPLIPMLSAPEETTPKMADGRPPAETDRPPRAEYATEYDRGSEEIEPLVPDLR